MVDCCPWVMQDSVDEEVPCSSCTLDRPAMRAASRVVALCLSLKCAGTAMICKKTIAMQHQSTPQGHLELRCLVTAVHWSAFLHPQDFNINQDISMQQSHC
jgi:hypothetical protein